MDDLIEVDRNMVPEKLVDYERNPTHSTSMIHIHMIGLMLNRLHNPGKN